MIRYTAFAAALALLPGFAPTTASACMTAGTGAKCVKAPVRTEVQRVSGPRWLRVAPQAPEYPVGQPLPDRFSIVLNTAYYDLPAPTADWLYYHVGPRIARVDRASREVLEYVD